MHQLILLCHAKAARESAGVSDHDRPLLPEGRRAAAAIASAMRKTGLSPDVVLVSSALRTQETLEELETADVWDERPNIDTLPALYMATSPQIRDAVKNLPETVRSALVIGHNPGLHEFATALAAPAPGKPDLTRLTEAFPTAALAEFLIPTAWHRLAFGTAALQRFLVPAGLV
jgi:phosphohistidine phosphatase